MSIAAPRFPHSHKTNREIFRQTSSPLCEYEPSMRREAHLSDAYHALATVELTGVPSLRLCAECAERHFPHRGSRPIRRH